MTTPPSDDFAALTDERRLALDDGETSALVLAPRDARAAYVFAHGAGAGMRHPFMAAFAAGLAARGVATFRFDFPFVEHGAKRPDPPAVAQAAVRRACAAAAAAFPGLPLFAGGKSFGGRMTSQAMSGARLADVRGLVFVGFPLHPAGPPSTTRADHLARVACPMLFLQGTRDALADQATIAGVVSRLGARATIATFDDADHAFHVRKSSGGDDARTRHAMLDVAVAWIDRVVAAR